METQILTPRAQEAYAAAADRHAADVGRANAALARELAAERAEVAAARARLISEAAHACPCACDHGALMRWQPLYDVDLVYGTLLHAVCIWQQQVLGMGLDSGTMLHAV